MSLTITFLVAGLVLGLSLFKLFKSKWAKAEVERKIKGKVAPCPECAANLPDVGRFLTTREARNIQLFKCAKCGSRSKWNFEVDPPDCLERERRRERPRRRDA